MDSFELLFSIINNAPEAEPTTTSAPIEAASRPGAAICIIA
jgi:hypothetical protein